MKNYSGDFATMLKKHVQTIVSHFQGKVVRRDVVNEALADDGEPSIGNNPRCSARTIERWPDYFAARRSAPRSPARSRSRRSLPQAARFRLREPAA
jgi:hypothetical protein